MNKMKVTFLRGVALLMLVFGVPFLGTTASADDSKNPQFDKLIDEIPKAISAYNRSATTKDSKNPSEDHSASKEFFTANLKAFIVSATLIDSLEVRRLAQEQNKSLSPQNLEVLSQTVVSDFKSFMTASGICPLYNNNSTDSNPSVTEFMKNLIKNDETSRVVKSFVIGSISSVNPTYTQGVIKAAAHLVLSHPELFEGINQKEQASIKLLLSAEGASLFYHGLIFGGPETRSAFFKVFLSLQIIIFNDSVLREVLWSHMVREGDSKDSNLPLKALAIVTSLDDKSFVWDHRNTALYLMQLDLKEFTASAFISVGVSEFMPDWFDDAETFALQWGQNQESRSWSARDASQFLTEFSKNKTNGLSTAEVEKYLVRRQHTRQDQMTTYFSMLKLALDRIDHLNVQNREENLLITYYQKLFLGAAEDANSLYADALVEMANLTKVASGPTQLRFTQESEHLQFLAKFTNYFIRSFKEKPQRSGRSRKYWATREALDQISFWGFPESEFLAK